ncbi:winged helix-turn-helix domain-containing protein [Pseudohongiella sp. SYSU M77423]|uniref:winged helix-turn-helix domain-containing tetratricopeptide repeat protein n=1 Tax=Pseudohongiella sp. SYSU M77423 TaxID=3042312 RepID=UPI002480FED8|nr:winged helix-turn-helix domain-containing protein [Pseudohongiella sp. SYSU M77423]MDH7943319.1 winged helix-turn-helix domain-containing protein [Pseudohongiella sp. SYSU M77423]
MADKTTIKMQDYQLVKVGDWEVSPGACTVSKNTSGTAQGQQNSAGELIENKVTPRSMDVLRLLIENAGQVVSPTQMLESIWRSPIATDHAVHKAIAELRGALQDDAHKPIYIKTIPKRGYTLIAPVTAVASHVAEDESSTDNSDPQTANRFPSASVGGTSADPRSIHAAQSTHTESPTAGGWSGALFGWLDHRPLWQRFFAAAMLIAMVVAAPVLIKSPESTPAADGVVRLAVLPFTSRDFSDENQILAEGIRESLIHGLAKLGHLQILSRPRGAEMINASMSRGGRYDDASELYNADHILQGSVMMSEGHLRVIVQLVRASDGLREYSDQFDLPMNDIFAVQDQIVENVVDALRIYLNDSEREQMRDWGTTNPLAYERFLRGEFYNNQFNPADWQRAMDYHRNAIELDPDFLNAYHGLATAANNLAVYSAGERIHELLQVVLDVHREISRIDPDSEILDSIHAIKLRMRGSSYVQQEMQLREQILSGNPPRFAMAHYALLLIGARMYDEASQFLDQASEVGPFEISPDEVWSYRHNVMTPSEAVIARKNELQQRPYHVSYLGSVAVNLALLGDFRQAQIYLTQQREVDQDGILTHYSESVINFLAGNIRADDNSYLGAMRDEPDFYFNNGVLAFMAGDIDTGVAYWQNLQPVHLRRLFNVTHAAEKLFPDHVLASSDYQDLLESLGAGISWQHRLMEGVMAMESITGISLSRRSRDAYENQQFMQKNNLWNEQQWAEYEHHKTQRLTQASTLNAARVH